jgi:hypothetical protein
MATDTQEPTSLQDGATPNPFPSNAQDFSDSDDEILDNFAEGPDDGTPMGLGGEKGKQSEPASSTLESDIVNGTKQPGEEILPEDSAGGPKPVQDAGETGEEKIPEPPSEEPETPVFPPALLQMAGLTDASAAQAAGFQNPEALFAAIKWRGQLLTPGAKPVQTATEKGLYRRPAQQPTVPVQPVATPVAEKTPEVKPFALPSEKMEMLDEDLQDVIRQMSEHYQQEIASLRASVSQRESDLAAQQQEDEEKQFDQIVQNLGEEWQDVFGEGKGRELASAAQSDPVAMTNFNHRALLFDTVDAIREVNAKQGYKPMSLEQEVQWALMQRYPDKFQKIISGNSNGNSGPRKGVTASRPTQRNTPPKGQNAKVLSSVDAMLRKKHGHGLDMGHEEELDGDI